MARGRAAATVAVVAATAAVASLARPASALYFYVAEGAQRCFIEEVPSDTLVVGTYSNPDFWPFGQPNFNGVVRC